MHIPAKLKIGCHEIEIDRLNRRQSEDRGYYDDWYDIIGITDEDGIPEAAQAEILMHEIFECLCVKYEITLDHKDITRLSDGVFQAIRDNDLDFRKP